MRGGSVRWPGFFPNKIKRIAAKKRQKQKCVQRWRPTLETLETRLVLASSFDTAISGTIINDVSANGVKDGGEDGLVDWVVYLDANLNGNFDAGERYEVTNADGDYLFTGLETGTHRVRQVIPSGWTSTGPDYVDLTLQLDQEKKARFFNVFTGSAGIGSISGAVWNDLDGDGDDLITADGAEGANDEIFGGDGNDLIDTGGGNDSADGGLGDDILLGGDGAEGAADTLQGGDGRDILVGDRGTPTVKSSSAGADSLFGEAGEDLVLASIYMPASTSAIVSIQSEWVSTRTYSERVANISGTGTGVRENGDNFLVPGGNVTNDRVGTVAVIDTVFGGDDQDWLMGDAAEDVTDIAVDEILTDL